MRCSSSSDRYTYFYPRPPRGGRQFVPIRGALPALFLSTPSARRATFCAASSYNLTCDFYPRPPRGGRPQVHTDVTFSYSISIHALREEGDAILAPDCAHTSVFLSTPSARRATYMQTCFPLPSDNFYPRPPRGGRRGDIYFSLSALYISIHALREEGDCRINAVFARLLISIHALREEGDQFTLR